MPSERRSLACGVRRTRTSCIQNGGGWQAGAGESANGSRLSGWEGAGAGVLRRLAAWVEDMLGRVSERKLRCKLIADAGLSADALAGWWVCERVNGRKALGQLGREARHVNVVCHGDCDGSTRRIHASHARAQLRGKQRHGEDHQCLGGRH
ncbi:hypothetical protein SVAN01_01250 [Stagonosporopsis vannaccii]|nr:hypothetical protein SVAN01_01250 [Stagonosporopsis vannaccii]